MAGDTADAVATEQVDNQTTDEGQQTGETSGQSAAGSETDAGQTQQGQQTDTANAETAKPVVKQPTWPQQRINELTKARREAEERAVRAEAALAAASRSESDDVQQADNGAKTQVDVDRLVAEGVEARVRQTKFNDDCNAVFNAGAKEFNGADGSLNFNDALAQLGMVGEITPHFIEAATALESGHRVLHHLGMNLDLASELLSLPPVKLAIRMTELNRELAKPKTQPVSRAAAPVVPVNGTARADLDLSRASLDDFMAARDRAAPIKR